MLGRALGLPDGMSLGESLGCTEGAGEIVGFCILVGSDDSDGPKVGRRLGISLGCVLGLVECWMLGAYEGVLELGTLLGV